MLLVVSIFSLLTSRSVTQVPKTRAEFAQAIASIRTGDNGWTEPQVRQLLGNPDDIWPANDSKQFVHAGQETWCYGSNGHHTFPTRGVVVFQNNVAIYTRGGGGIPPSETVISEDELVGGLRALESTPKLKDDFSGRDPLRFIQATNLLLPLGKEKILAVLHERKRLDGQFSSDSNDTWLYWLTHVLFKTKSPGAAFPQPKMIEPTNGIPENLLSSPSFPIYLINDVPLNVLIFGSSISRDPFLDYLDRNQADWVLRSTPLKPPNDPFLLWQDLKISSADKSMLDFHLVSELLALVRTAYTPTVEKGDYTMYPPTSLDKLHSEFLKVGAYWDQKREAYVRANGSELAQVADEYEQFLYTFDDVPGLKLKLAFSRQDSKYINFGCEFKEVGDEPIKTAVIVIEDATSGEQITFRAVNSRAFRAGRDTRSIKDLLAEEPHASRSSGGSSGGCEVPTGKSFRFVLLIGSQRYVSGDYTL